MLDTTNTNNHAGILRQENTEKAEALLKMINEYRVYANRFASLPTWDILQWLSKLESEVMERYNKEVFDWERERIKNEYYRLTGKKPFLWWSNEEIQQKMEEYVESDADIAEDTLKSKKSRWKKAMNKGGK